MSPAEDILACLAGRRPVAARVTIVAAHPDDETIGLGAQLYGFADALLLHATDGAPRDGHDARAYGFAAAADYAAARRAELAAALRAGGAAHLRAACLGVPDKETMRDLAGLARRVAERLRAERSVAVFTHAYEGGHPDHDSCAFAVHAACRLLDEPPAVIEMPLYHRAEGRLVAGQFIAPPPRSSPGRREWTVPLDDEQLRRKWRMIDCFATQRWLLAQLDPSVERFRRAQRCDFRQPPHPGELHFETLGWGITGAQWRDAAAAALDRLGLADLPCL